MVVQLTEENFDKYADQYIKIYTKKFKVKFDISDLKKQMKNSRLFVYIDKGKVLGIMRIKYISVKDKYLSHFKFRKAIFLSDLAADTRQKGIGKKLLKYLFRIADRANLPIITVPWNDSLLQYYTQYGFGAYYFKDKSLPKVIMIKLPKNKSIVKTRY